MIDSGKVTFCDLIDTGTGGSKPRPVLQPVYTCLFENRIVGVNRRYAAKGVNEEISALIRIWRPPLRENRAQMVQVGMIAVIEESEQDGQYRVEGTQPLNNFDRIAITEITLTAVEKYYDLAEEATKNP